VSNFDLAIVELESTEFSPDMASTDERFNQAFERIKALETQHSTGNLASSVQPHPAAGIQTQASEGFIARNRSILIPTAISVLGILVMIWQVKAPQAAQNEDERFWLKMDKHIADQIKEPLDKIQATQQQQAGDFRELKGTLDVVAKIILPQALPDRLKKHGEPSRL
jgi:hypothetical protein